MSAVTVTTLSLASVGLAFVAGLASFLSPCVLPLLPVYLSYMSGVAADELVAQRRRLTALSLLFVMGFACVFVLLGMGAGGIGRLLIDYRRPLTIGAGIFIALSGLAVAGALPRPLRALAVTAHRAGPWQAFLTGAALAIAWTPCVGYVLAGILVLAGSSQSPWRGAVLLLVYSAGLGAPFVAAAAAFSHVVRRLAPLKRHYRVVEIAAGALLLIFGVLLATGVFGRLSHALPGVGAGGL